MCLSLCQKKIQTGVVRALWELFQCLRQKFSAKLFLEGFGTTRWREGPLLPIVLSGTWGNGRREMANLRSISSYENQGPHNFTSNWWPTLCQRFQRGICLENIPFTSRFSRRCNIEYHRLKGHRLGIQPKFRWILTERKSSLLGGLGIHQIPNHLKCHKSHPWILTSLFSSHPCNGRHFSLQP